MPPFGGFSGFSGSPSLTAFDTVVGRMIHSGLSRYDAGLRPIDDLAHCVVADDQVTIRCKLVEATFQDGSPVTAADVVFSYEVAARQCFSLCDDTKPAMGAEGQRTVVFRLARPDATFMSLVLPAIPIEPEAMLRAAHARLMTKAQGADPDMLREAGERYGAVADKQESQACQAQLPEAERLLRDVGYEPWNGAEFEISRPGGGLDYCSNLAFLGWRLGDAADALDPTLDPITALAHAYPLLDINRAKPIGAGPWAFESYDAAAGRLDLTAHRGYHGDPAATEHVVVFRITDEDRAEDMLQGGKVDWWASPSSLRNTDWAVADPEFQVARYPDLTYYVLSYNVRPGRLFHDKRLRQAMEYCIDKASTVEVATGGRGIVINSPVPPGSWAYQDLAVAPYEPEYGRALIEGAGWTMGDDGIYVKDGERLSFKVAVRNDAQNAEVARGVGARLKFLELAAWKLSRCGIELKTDQMAFSEEMGLLRIQGLPGRDDAAIDAALYGLVMFPDPDDDSWDSSQTPERLAEQDPGYESSEDGAPNWTGFASSDVDALLKEGLSTYDIYDRGRIYREYQKELSRELPAMFLYSLEAREVMRTALRSRDEPLDLSAPRWWWKLEGLVVDRPAPSPDTSP